MVLMEIVVRLEVPSGLITDEQANEADDALTELNLSDVVYQTVRSAVNTRRGLENVLVNVSSVDEGGF